MTLQVTQVLYKFNGSPGRNVHKIRLLCLDFCFICFSTYQLIILHFHIFTFFISLKDIRSLFFMSIQISVHFYEPDPVANQMKVDCAIARVRDFWAWESRVQSNACPCESSLSSTARK